MSAPAEPRDREDPATPGEALQALACLLPAGLCAWPGAGALLRTDPWPQIAGAGLALLAALPALALLVLRGRFPGVRCLTLLLVPLLVAVGWISLGDPSDTLEASRALFVSLAGLALLFAAAGLGPFGRRVLARGLALLALAYVLPALFDAERGSSGALGNTGSLAQAALPGAAAGALLWIVDRGAWRVVGASATLVFVFYAGRVPVLAGALALALALVPAALRASGRARLALALAAVLALLALAHPWRAASGSTPASAAPATGTAAAGDTGGLAVRAHVLRRSLALARSEWLAGVGPGQFAARFPPWRDPREIELSTHQRRLETETEVEHPHDDWIAPLVEGGLVAGLCWIGFLLAAAWAAWRALAASEPLAAAALALLANAAAHGVLTFDPVSSSLAYACFGALLARAEPSNGGFARRFLPLCLLGLCALQAPRAWRMLQHGQALSDMGRLDLASGSLERAIDRALAACPDSVPALSLRARTSPAAQRDPAVAEACWRSVLALRPNRFEAWMQLGTLAARAERREEALAAFTHAAGLDPEHPGLLANFVTLLAECGRTAAALGALEALQASHPRDAQWIAGRGALAWLAGQEETARALFGKSGAFALPEQPGLCLAQSKERRERGETLLADCLESAAQRGWAREHAGRAAWADAVRSYRQELRISRDYEREGARVVRFELAAALALDEKPSEARELLDVLAPVAAELERLPEWAREALAPLR